MGLDHYGTPEGLTEDEIRFFAHKTFDEHPDSGDSRWTAIQYLTGDKNAREQNRKEYLDFQAKRKAQFKSGATAICITCLEMGI